MSAEMEGWNHTVRVMLVFPVLPVVMLFCVVGFLTYLEDAKGLWNRGRKNKAVVVGVWGVSLLGWLTAAVWFWVKQVREL